MNKFNEMRSALDNAKELQAQINNDELRKEYPAIMLQNISGVVFFLESEVNNLQAKLLKAEKDIDGNPDISEALEAILDDYKSNGIDMKEALKCLYSTMTWNQLRCFKCYRRVTGCTRSPLKCNNFLHGVPEIKTGVPGVEL